MDVDNTLLQDPSSGKAVGTITYHQGNHALYPMFVINKFEIGQRELFYTFSFSFHYPLGIVFRIIVYICIFELIHESIFMHK